MRGTLLWILALLAALGLAAAFRKAPPGSVTGLVWKSEQFEFTLARQPNGQGVFQVTRNGTACDLGALSPGTTDSLLAQAAALATQTLAGPGPCDLTLVRETGNETFRGENPELKRYLDSHLPGFAIWLRAQEPAKDPVLSWMNWSQPKFRFCLYLEPHLGFRYTAELWDKRDRRQTHRGTLTEGEGLELLVLAANHQFGAGARMGGPGTELVVACPRGWWRSAGSHLDSSCDATFQAIAGTVIGREQERTLK